MSTATETAPRTVVAHREHETWIATRDGVGWTVRDHDGDLCLTLPDCTLTAEALEVAMEAWWAGYARGAVVARRLAAAEQGAL